MKRSLLVPLVVLSCSISIAIPQMAYAEALEAESENADPQVQVADSAQAGQDDGLDVKAQAADVEKAMQTPDAAPKAVTEAAGSATESQAEPASASSAASSASKAQSSTGASGQAAQQTAAAESTKTDPASASSSTSTETAATVTSQSAKRAAAKAPASTAASEQTVENGVYVISSDVNSSRVLDVEGGSTANGAAVQIYAKNNTPAQRWRFTYMGNGLYKIVSVASGKALDVSGAVVANGSVIQQYASNDTSAQRWRIVSVNGLYKFVSALNSAYVLDVTGASSANGTHVQLYRDNGTNAQLWGLSKITAPVSTGYYTIVNAGSGKALDVSGASLENGANVQQYASNGTMAQTYLLNYDANSGYYTIYNAASGKALDVSGAGAYNGANVQQYQYNGTRAQKWTIQANGDGTYRLVSAISGLVLDVSGGSHANNANVQTYQWNGTAAQKWNIAAVDQWLPEGTYYIASAVNHGNVIDVVGAGRSAGTNVEVYASNATNAQRFYFAPAGNGYYAIFNTNSGLSLGAASASSGANVRLSSSVQYWRPVLTKNGIVFHLKDNDSVVLDVAGASTASGANVQVYASNGTAAQGFSLLSTNFISEGLYTIRLARDSRYVVSDPGAATTAGTKIQLGESNGSASQAFTLRLQSDGTYKIINMASQKALQAAAGSYDVTQQAISGSNNQNWVLGFASDGGMVIRNKGVGTDYVLDLSGNNAAEKTQVGLYQYNGTGAQKWTLQPATIAYYQLSATLDQMAQWQRNGISYYKNYTLSQMKQKLDPNTKSSYEFVDLRVTTGITANQLNDFINSNSLGRSGNLKGMGTAFVAAAKAYCLNEVYLLSHAILESAWGTSHLASGDTGAYNFYGIGAYDSDPEHGSVVANQEGWTTPYGAIMGAAKWISKNYVNDTYYPQNTLYEMKWNSNYCSAITPGSVGHEYATDVDWAGKIANIMEQCYAYLGVSPTLSYIVTKYA